MQFMGSLLPKLFIDHPACYIVSALCLLGLQTEMSSLDSVHGRRWGSGCFFYKVLSISQGFWSVGLYRDWSFQVGSSWTSGSGSELNPSVAQIPLSPVRAGAVGWDSGRLCGKGRRWVKSAVLKGQSRGFLSTWRITGYLRLEEVAFFSRKRKESCHTLWGHRLYSSALLEF